jgi:hypothetical protein
LHPSLGTLPPANDWWAIGNAPALRFGGNFTLVVLTDNAFPKPAHCADQDTDPTECITYRGLPPNRNRVALVTASPQVKAGLPLQTNLGFFAPGNTQP